MFDINISVKKRDGSVMAYDISKIEKAIMQALIATEEIPYNQMSLTAQRAATLVERGILNRHQNQNPIASDDNNAVQTSVEEIQDVVEETLMRMELTKTAKAYILYRKQHEKVREKNSTLLDVKEQIEGFIGPVKDWRVKENSTVTATLGGLILSNSGALTANYWLNEVYDEDIRNAHTSADIHIHDLSMLSGYCAGWSLKQLIERGIMGVEGRIASAPAKHLSTLTNQMVNFLGILQNEWAGKSVPA